jgi:endonuclease/exonuclease/phosphatase family metal-dependent hydrolase
MKRTPVFFAHLLPHIQAITCWVLLLFFVGNLPNSYCQLPASSGGKQLHIGFYNVENLMDIDDNPKKNDDEFTPNGKMQWTADRYNTKLSQLAKVIGAMARNNSPDLMGLCEVENQAVLQDLVKQKAIKSSKYQIIHRESEDERGVDVALLYKPKVFKPVRTYSYRVRLPGADSSTRNVLVVTGTTWKKDTLTVIVNHWPSRRNPVDTRLFTAKRVRGIVDSLLTRNPEARIVLMGDFNDSPSDESLRILVQPAANSSLPGPPPLVPAMMSLHQAGKGTHCFKQEWNLLDQFVLSPAITAQKHPLRYNGNQVAIFSPEWLQDTFERNEGCPLRTYVGNKYIGGYSDHFPIEIALDFKP